MNLHTLSNRTYFYVFFIKTQKTRSNKDKTSGMFHLVFVKLMHQAGSPAAAATPSGAYELHGFEDNQHNIIKAFAHRFS